MRPSDAIWRQWSWTTLAQVMACCLTAPSHYLNQCWLIIRGVLWHTSESSFAGIAQGIDSGYEFEKYILKNIFKSPRGQWVKAELCLRMFCGCNSATLSHRYVTPNMFCFIYCSPSPFCDFDTVENFMLKVVINIQWRSVTDSIAIYVTWTKISVNAIWL